MHGALKLVLAFATVLAPFVTAACAHPTPRSPPTPPPPTRWLCDPQLARDVCRDADLSATEVRADGSRAVVASPPADPSPSLDCFYVYPTVDLDLVPRNHEDLADDDHPRAVTLAQAARLRQTCALWVPLYRQVTIGTYLQPKDALEHGLARGFADVERAFADFLARRDRSRGIVLVGHSQGAEMVVRLLRRFFERDAALRAQLRLALVVGDGVDTGTLESVHACTRPRETGCLVAYQTYAAGEKVDPDRWAPHPGRETVCTTPAALDRGDPPDTPEPLAGSYFVTWPEVRRFLRGAGDVRTPFVLARDRYTARCVRGPGAYAYLEVKENDDAVPFALHDKRARIGKLGLHLLDLQLPQADLVELVRSRR